MKKTISSITALLISAVVFCQNLDTVSANLTLRARDWGWSIGKYGHGTDSATQKKVRQIRDAVQLANPQAPYNSNVTVNNLSGKVIYEIYKMYVNATFGEYMNMGSTDAERRTIFTNIRAINNSALQYFIGITDGRYGTIYTDAASNGKSILIDN